MLSSDVRRGEMKFKMDASKHGSSCSGPSIFLCCLSLDPLLLERPRVPVVNPRVRTEPLRADTAPSPPTSQARGSPSNPGSHLNPSRPSTHPPPQPTRTTTSSPRPTSRFSRRSSCSSTTGTPGSQRTTSAGSSREESTPSDFRCVQAEDRRVEKSALTDTCDDSGCDRLGTTTSLDWTRVCSGEQSLSSPGRCLRVRGRGS